MDTESGDFGRGFRFDRHIFIACSAREIDRRSPSLCGGPLRQIPSKFSGTHTRLSPSPIASALAALDGAAAAINLAGANIAGHRWTAGYKNLLDASRVAPTRALALLLARLMPRPRVLVCASAVGIYGNRRRRDLQRGVRPGERLFGGGLPKLGTGHRTGNRRRYPGGASAFRRGAFARRGSARADAASLPPRIGRPSRLGPAVDELGRFARRPRRHRVCARNAKPLGAGKRRSP